MTYELLIKYPEFQHKVYFRIDKEDGVRITRYSEVVLEKELSVTDDIDSQFIAKELQFWLLNQDRKLWGCESHSLNPALSPEDLEKLQILEVLDRI